MKHGAILSMHGWMLGGLFCTLFSLQAVADEIKIVVTAAFVSEQGLEIYDEMADYISEKMKVPVALVSGTSYEESDMLLKRSIVQVGFICGFPYIRNEDYQLIAVPVMAIENRQFEDAPSYRDVPGKYFSYTIVRKDSPITDWEGLRGKSYVYNDQSSNSGYNMPRFKLIQLGEKRWEDYFSSVRVSGSHEESIRMVSRGEVDASSVDSLVLDYDRHYGDLDARNVRIIEVLFKEGAGAPPVVANRSLSPELQQRLQQVLTRMHEDPEGRALLSKALIKRFAPPDDGNYDDIRAMDDRAQQVGFVDHVE